MSQVSRPFQIALAAVLLFAVAWFAVLKQHATASSQAGSSPSLSAPSQSPSSQSAPSQSAGTPSSAAAQAKEAAKPTHVYKGSAPGVEGLTRDVRRAHEAVGKSNANASATEHASARVSGEASSGAAATGKASSGSANKASSTSAASTKSGSASRTSSANASGGGSGSAASGAPQTHLASSPANRIASQLHQGKTVLLLFWNPKSSTNTTVREQVSNAARSLGGNVAVTYAKADEVGAFGTITRSVTVNQTPTLLIIGKQGLISTITGLTDAFAIEQAVREARS